MPSQPESAFKQMFDRWFERLYPQSGHRYRTAIEKGPGQRSGLPDRFYCAGGGHAWVEFKVAPFQASKLQHYTCQRLARGGSRVLIVTRRPETSQQLLVEEFDRAGESGQSAFCMEAVRQKAFWRWMMRTSSPRKVSA